MKTQTVLQLGARAIQRALRPYWERRERQRRREQRLRLLQTGALVGGAVGALAGAGYLWWSRRMKADEYHVEVVDRSQIPAPLLPDTVESDTQLQLLADGEGSMFHRSYRIDIASPAFTPEAMMDVIKADLNGFIPREMAYFEKTKGSERAFVVGDEYFIHIAGPWNGPVRTVEVTPTSFSFATRTGHLEAGEIHFRTLPHPDQPNALRFEILSWARSRDSVVSFLYEKVGIVRAAQTAMWVTFCKQVCAKSGGEPMGEVAILTERTPYRFERPPRRARPSVPLYERYQDTLTQLQERAYNFDLEKREDYTKINGWHIDDYQVELPPEQPGEPASNGSWKLTCDVIRNYEFPDPSIITGIFIPDTPLKDRVMLLQARFLVFSFLFGVRVGEVYEERRNDPEYGEAVVWGYNYRTLQGHWEMGEISFTAWKFIESGRVEFRIHAFSKVGFIPNIFYRIGFAIFGRGLQIKFSRSALERTRLFVVDRLQPDLPDTPQETVDVKPAHTDEKAAEKIEEIRN